ncbi:MAG: acetyl-CoA carboxylase carboxyltransferase subunit alpha [Gammaproteobacteria bacterium]
MNHHFLEFEQPIAELEAKIKELRMMSSDTEINIGEEIERLRDKCDQLTRTIYADLSAWQVAQMARHPLRPHTLDYIKQIFTDFDEIEGDRHYSNAPTIVSGLARLNDKPVVIIGHEKGTRTKEKVYRNFGMARPEAYRKALRVMQLAEKFKLPLFTFIDTAGAYPGIGAEEHNQSEAIAQNLYVMSQLKIPIICTVTGEGGSGGALAIGVGDRVLMLQFSIYSVISPEGCASILWKNAEKAEDAAKAMKITAQSLLDFGLIDEIIAEPLGGAHRNVERIAQDLKATLTKQLDQLQALSCEELIAQRYQRLMSLGALE